MKTYYSKLLPHSVEDLIIDFVYSREVHRHKTNLLRELHIEDFFKRISKMYESLRIMNLTAYVI